MSGISGFCTPDASCNYTNSINKWQTILDEMNKEFCFSKESNHNHLLYPNIGLTASTLSVNNRNKVVQPLIIEINNNTFSIVFYGELYNNHQLIKTLNINKDVISSNSDSEIVLNGFIEYGPEFVNKLSGAFSFVIWDERKKTLYMFRDPIGIKPLFYSISGKTIVFSSKISSLFKFPKIKAELDTNSYCEIFGLGPAKTHGTGVFKNIKEVIPGCFNIFNQSGLYSQKFWELKSLDHHENYSETVDHISSLLNHSVESQFESDYPACTLLSGGLDSSLISAICSNILLKQNKTLDTYSFDFIDNSINFKSSSFQPSQDRPYVDIMKNHLKSNHNYLQCDNDDLINGLYEAVDARDLPNMADVESSLLYFCKTVSKKHSLALTGECADEIFGGYPWFHDSDSFTLNSFPWSRNMDTRKLLLSDDFLSQIGLDEYVGSAYKNTIMRTPRLDSENKIEERRREISYLNIKWFMTTLIDRMDRTSIYSNLIARSPFADIKLIEYAWNIPWEMKYSNNTSKGLLRDVAKGILPDDILYRKKSPYPKTYNPEYEKRLGRLLLNELSDLNSPLRDILDLKKVEKFLQAPSDYGKPWYGQLMAAPQLIAYLLQINYWMKKFL
ncbi:MAG TPA: asparagine synthase (glutamine-hydrolyzing) [Clostridiales bacterium]|nr:asparagine synthase (glutamine-hydrolyzing) [Clostridiales bacterium]